MTAASKQTWATMAYNLARYGTANPCHGRHDWRDIYGDEINAADCRSICRKCGARSDALMNRGDR